MIWIFSVSVYLAKNRQSHDPISRVNEAISTGDSRADLLLWRKMNSEPLFKNYEAEQNLVIVTLA